MKFYLPTTKLHKNEKNAWMDCWEYKECLIFVLHIENKVNMVY